WFGTSGSEVRILSRRPFFFSKPFFNIINTLKNNIITLFDKNKKLKLTYYKISYFLYFSRSEITKKCNLKEKEYLLNKFKIEKEEDIQHIQNKKVKLPTIL
ncbi:MAG: hypothetical protein J6586_12680, partial [Snodgrassella sp.]|nr:hypothetical protein [Snodgrassella sp.]